MKEEKEEEKDQFSVRARQVSVVHSHPPSHNIRNIISMTLLDTKCKTLFPYM